MNLAELAARNYAERKAQLQRLAPVRQEAKAKAETFRQLQGGTKDIRAGMELMASLKHVPNFFPTPRKLVLQMIERAGIQDCHRVLEPSAGKGDILKAIASQDVVAVEFNYKLAEHLRQHFPRLDVRCSDFLEMEPEPTFDRVLMNPPFERGIDEDHLRHALQFLKPGGRLVAIVSAMTGSRLTVGEVESLPDGTFANSERPTQVRTAIVTIDN
jgi:protein-L-isoaspartate O-methyltransferase